jgi:hypothetical protein
MDRYPYLDPSVVKRVDQHDEECYTKLAQEGMPPSGSFRLPGVSPRAISVPTMSCSSHPTANPASSYTTPTNAPLWQVFSHHPQISSSLAETPWMGFNEPDRTVRTRIMEARRSPQVPVHQTSALQFDPNTLQDDSRGFDNYMDLRRPSMDVYPSQPSSATAAAPPTPCNHLILHSLPTLSWNTWKNPLPFPGCTTTSYYASTVQPTMTSLKPSGSKNVQGPPDGQLISLVSPNVVAPVSALPSSTPVATASEKGPPYDPLKGPPPRTGGIPY